MPHNKPKTPNTVLSTLMKEIQPLHKENMLSDTHMGLIGNIENTICIENIYMM